MNLFKKMLLNTTCAAHMAYGCRCFNYVAFLGSGKVGKSAIVERILNAKFSGQYKETVDELYKSEFSFNGENMCVDILDTAGSIAFPAMRRLAITNARAFVLVYTITDRNSYIEMQELWQEIKTERYDYRIVPCVVVANKLDREEDRQVSYLEGIEWVENEGVSQGFLEVSAKENSSVTTIFELLKLHRPLTKMKKR